MKSVNCVVALAFVCSVVASPMPEPGTIQVIFDGKLGNKWRYDDSPYASGRYPTDKNTILDRLEKDGRFKKLLKVVSHSKHLRDELDDPDRKVSMFAPTDCAFEEMEKNMVERERHHEDMEDILAYHILKKEYDYRDLKHMRTVESSLKLESLNGEHQRIRIMTFAGRLYVERALIEDKLDAHNGNIFVLDKIMMPPADISTKMYSMAPFFFSITYSALSHVELIHQFTNKELTMFLPTNQAWHGLCPDTLLYLFSPHGKKDMKELLMSHIVEGLEYAHWKEGSEKRLKSIGGTHIDIEVYKQGHMPVIMLNKESKVTFADGPAENGVAHAINYPLIPHHMRSKLSERCQSNRMVESEDTMQF